MNRWFSSPKTAPGFAKQRSHREVLVRSSRQELANNNNEVGGAARARDAESPLPEHMFSNRRASVSASIADDAMKASGASALPRYPIHQLKNQQLYTPPGTNDQQQANHHVAPTANHHAAPTAKHASAQVQHNREADHDDESSLPSAGSWASNRGRSQLTSNRSSPPDDAEEEEDMMLDIVELGVAKCCSKISWCSKQKTRLISLRAGLIVMTGSYGLGVTILEFTGKPCVDALTIAFLIISFFSVVFGIASISVRTFSIYRATRDNPYWPDPYRTFCFCCCSETRSTSCGSLALSDERKTFIAHSRKFFVNVLAVVQALVAFGFLLCPGISPPSIPVPGSLLNETCASELINSTEFDSVFNLHYVEGQLSNSALLFGVIINAVHFAFGVFEMLRIYGKRFKTQPLSCLFLETGMLLAVVPSLFILLADLPFMILPFFHNIIVGVILNNHEKYWFSLL